MAKRGLGRLVALAAVAGAAAAGVSYVLQYKIYHKELEKDFREFEDDEEEEPQDEEAGERKVSRNYISLTSSKDEFKVAAKDMAQATKNVLKDAGTLLSDTAHEAVSAAVDTAHIAIHTMKAKKEEFQEGRDQEDEDEDSFEEEGFLDEDYVDEDDLYDYERMEPEPEYEEEVPEEAEKPVVIELEDEDAADEEPEIIPAEKTTL
ncbi:MAG: hypothetical protein ACLTNH_15560, partial [Enterocloster sp.]